MLSSTSPAPRMVVECRKFLKFPATKTAATSHALFKRSHAHPQRNKSFYQHSQFNNPNLFRSKPNAIHPVPSTRCTEPQHPFSAWTVPLPGVHLLGPAARICIDRHRRLFAL